MRILLDTNVAMSALLWRGTPYRLLDAVRRRRDVGLVSSPTLLEELADVLTRPSAARRLAVIGKSVNEVMADYIESIELVSPVAVPRVVPGDIDDDHVVAAAVAGNVEFIVTGDATLLNLGRHGEIELLSAAIALLRFDS